MQSEMSRRRLRTQRPQVDGKSTGFWCVQEEVIPVEFGDRDVSDALVEGVTGQGFGVVA
jgi:hypothetical protein